MGRLNIHDRRERAVVAAADALLLPLGLMRRLRRRPRQPPARVICLRLERIGDLLMTLPALATLRAALPAAAIDLAVGSWNRDVAAAIPGIDRIETLDAAWLARPAGAGLGPLALAASAARLRARRYDLAINFEPDIRTNAALAAIGAARAAGFVGGGGAAFLDVAVTYDASAHTADNAVRLARAASGYAGAAADLRLRIPEPDRMEAERLLRPFAGRLRIGMHVSGGRAIKQWPEERFREVACRLAADRHAAIVFTGSPDERDQIARVRDAVPGGRALDLTGESLLRVAAVIQQLDLFVTGDTGPMHLAHAVGTPVVAVFGPSDPARYAPRGSRDRVVRVDLPCSPCNRIRRPPRRCTGHTPDCLAGVQTAAVLAAVDEAIAAEPRR